MESLRSSGSALVAIAFVLGMKHGFDADQLATIGGVAHALVLAPLFVAGMLVVDALNGVVLARLARLKTRSGS